MAGANFKCFVVTVQPTSFRNPMKFKETQVALSECTGKMNLIAKRKKEKTELKERVYNIHYMSVSPKKEINVKRNTCLVCILAL